MHLGIISDIHEDFNSLQSALEIIKKQNVDRIICLGDIVGYEYKYYNYDDTRSAQKCINLLKRHNILSVAGNHDILASERIPENAKKIGFPENWYSISMANKEYYYGDKFFLYENEAPNDLSKEGEEYLENLNSFELLNIIPGSILLSHFIYPDINGNVLHFSNRRNGFSKHLEWMKSLNCNISFVGHAHIEGIGIANRKGLKIYKFGKYTLKNENQIVLCPPIARGKYKNGFILFDTDTKIIEVISL